MKFTCKIGFAAFLFLTLLLAACVTTPANVAQDPQPDTAANTTDDDISLPEADEAPLVANPVESEDELAPDSEIAIYFLDVGQGAAAFIMCDNETMLIDGGSAASSSLIYSFLDRLSIDHIDYIVNTHPHEDHVGGLPGALNRVSSVGVALSSVTEYDSRAFNSFVKYLGDHGVDITVPDAGDSFKLGSATVEVIAPLNEYSDENNNSIVLMVTYGETSFLFTGDAERESEQDMVEAGPDLSATVLYVAHHGSDTSTTYPFLREVMPEIAIISCGSNNQYGHPHENTLSRLRDADVTLYRTDLQGDIIIISDGMNVSVTTEKNTDVRTNPTDDNESNEENYIGNKNSKKLHRPDCKTLPAEQNRVFFETVQDGLNAGYEPCKNCKP